MANAEFVKKIDIYLIKSFIPPFIISFLIALFVLVMQTIYIYLDDFMDKGIGLFILIEMLFYLSIRLFPMALAIGVLLASVMVFGNLGEKYELSSFKSAGISLFRIMLPLIMLVTLISVFSYLSNDFLSPKANLKFHSRLWDIRRQKPTLSIEEGIFNDDFGGYTIWVKEKDKNERMIQNVKIYNQTTHSSNLDVISASNGEMYSSEDGKYFIMHLEDGFKYQEMSRKIQKGGKYSYPFVRVEFKNWQKAFDLGEFELEATDEELFKSHHYMKTSWELLHDIDTFNQKMEEIPPNAYLRLKNVLKVDSVEILNPTEGTLPSDNPEFKINRRVVVNRNEDSKDDRADETQLVESENIPVKRSSYYTPKVSIKDPDSLEAGNMVEMFATSEQKRLLISAKTSLSRMKSDLITAKAEMRNTIVNRAKFTFEFHSKFSLAVACLIFLFIGAPMGAIVRKGGFGFPFLISIIFFAMFIILTIAMRKMSKNLDIDPTLAAWFPAIITFVIGVFLTTKAMNDSKMMNLERYTGWIMKIFRKYFSST